VIGMPTASFLAEDSPAGVIFLKPMEILDEGVVI
jgi:hypothetical protein